MLRNSHRRHGNYDATPTARRVFRSAAASRPAALSWLPVIASHSRVPGRSGATFLCGTPFFWIDVAPAELQAVHKGTRERMKSPFSPSPHTFTSISLPQTPHPSSPSTQCSSAPLSLSPPSSASQPPQAAWTRAPRCVDQSFLQSTVAHHS